jgi:guanylate kinase
MLSETDKAGRGMRDAKTKGILFVISAPSGAGKTSICRAILQRFPKLRQSVSYTTRTMRPGEQDGVDYRFVSREVFDRMVAANAFAEWAEVHGNRYGTARATLETVSDEGADVLLEIDIQGAEQLRSSGLGGVFIFILPPTMRELRKRLDCRNTDDDQVIARRMANASGEIAKALNFDYLVVNDELEQAVEKVWAIMIAEAARTVRVVKSLPQEFGLKKNA